VISQNLQMLGKLETFTGATLQHLTEKGQLNGDATITLAKYIMESRTEKADALVALQVQQQANQEQTQFVQRQLQELAAGSNKTERDAVIVIDKKDAGPGKVRLNYLVDSASWRPQYKFRAGKNKDAVQLEYLAAVVQQTGEDWSHVHMILSTAQPMLNAAPPELKMLEVAVVPRRPAGGKGGGMPESALRANLGDFQKKATQHRGEAQKDYRTNKQWSADDNLNRAAAFEQAGDFLAARAEDLKALKPKSVDEGPSVTYHLQNQLTIPSRNDEQIIEVAKIDMEP